MLSKSAKSKKSSSKVLLWQLKTDLVHPNLRLGVLAEVEAEVAEEVVVVVDKVVEVVAKKRPPKFNLCDFTGV